MLNTGNSRNHPPLSTNRNSLSRALLQPSLESQPQSLAAMLLEQSLSTRHKVFLSYYHKQDQCYKDRFEKLFGNQFINKSVKTGDINADTSDPYIKRLIQEGYLSDASVVVVLCGQNTWGRKHVDWEISGGLNTKLKGNSGLVGILLPTHPSFHENECNPATIPERLRHNIESGYAKLYNWTEDVDQIKEIIENAFQGRKNGDLINNSKIQMQRNTATSDKTIIDRFYGETNGYE